MMWQLSTQLLHAKGRAKHKHLQAALSRNSAFPDFLTFSSLNCRQQALALRTRQWALWRCYANNPASTSTAIPTCMSVSDGGCTMLLVLG